MQDQDKKKIIRKISIRVIVILLLAVIAAAVSIRVLNTKTAELDEKIEEAKSADTVRPVSDEEDETITSEADETEAESDENKEDKTEDTSTEEEETNQDLTAEDDTTEEETDDTSTQSDDEDESNDSEEESDEDESTADDESVNSSTSAGDASATATPTPTKTSSSSTVATPTPAPTSTPTATPAPTATPTPVPTATPTPTPTLSNPTPINYSEDLTYVTAAQTALFKSRLLEDINNYRASNGMGSLTMDDCLTSGASIRANEISTYWSHTRPNGERGIYVLAGCGGYYEYAVNCIKNGLPHDYAFGENLAVSYSWSNYTGTDQEIIDIADETFNNWVNSETHRENLLYSGYTKIGLGLYVNMDGDTYHAFWTCALFANK